MHDHVKPEEKIRENASSKLNEAKLCSEIVKLACDGCCITRTAPKQITCGLGFLVGLWPSCGGAKAQEKHRH